MPENPRSPDRARHPAAWRWIAAVGLAFALAACAGTPPVADPEPPTATLSSPPDGASFAWFDAAAEPNSYPVAVAGFGVGDGGVALPGSDLAWSYRRVGSADWSAAGTGTATTIDLTFFGSTVFQDWELRLIASEGALASEPAVVTITVQRPPD